MPARNNMPGRNNMKAGLNGVGTPLNPAFMA